MLYDNMKCFTKENLEIFLKELAKEFRKINGTTMPAEIILIGGAAILANYGFRNMTMDIDAIIHSSSAMKEAINRVGDRFGLPNAWLNTDFMRTSSYSSKLDEVSVYYGTYANILTVRTVSAEYLIAMKLRAGRKYKNDLSDIIGILAEHKKQNNPITIKQIELAVEKLYGDWESISADSKEFIHKIFANENYEKLYEEIIEEERKSRDIVIEFEEEYPGVLRESNLNEILEKLKSK